MALIDVLMPYRASSKHRMRVFLAMREAWDAVDFPVEVIVGVDDSDGPFNLSKAANTAFARSAADIVLLHGVDHIPPTPDKLAWIVERLAYERWVPLYCGTRVLDKGMTEKVIADVKRGHVPLNPQIYSPVSRFPSCTGVMAFRREAWDQLGWMDERFYGWGCEDTALRLAAESVFGLPSLPYGDLTTLWHPRAPRDRFSANSGILGEYIAAHHAGRMAAYLESR